MQSKNNIEVPDHFKKIIFMDALVTPKKIGLHCFDLISREFCAPGMFISLSLVSSILVII
jgi:hypothetical protein